MAIKIDKDEIYKRLKLKHPEYTFDMSDYLNTHSKIKTICDKGHESIQTVKNLLKGHGCNTCGNNRSSEKQKSNFDDVLKKFRSKHGDKYDYSDFVYKKNRINSTINCPEHGPFQQSAWSHMNGNGCASCSNNKKLDTENFIKRAKSVHTINYDYSNVEYVNMKTPVTIICPKHGPFTQVPATHVISGSGCPVCSQSYGERLIELFLNKNKISYVRQKKFKECSYKQLLPFDFFLPEYNTCIEFNGIQHYQPVELFGGEPNYKLTILRDSIKQKFCDDNSIKLIIIKQDRKHIDKKDVNLQIENIINILNIKESL